MNIPEFEMLKSHFDWNYAETLNDVSGMVKLNLDEVLKNPVKIIIERKEEITNAIWWKSYNTLLLQQLANELWYKVPYTKFISTDLHKEILNLWEIEVWIESVNKFDSFLDDINEFWSSNESISDEILKLIWLLLWELKDTSNWENLKNDNIKINWYYETPELPKVIDKDTLIDSTPRFIENDSCFVIFNWLVKDFVKWYTVLSYKEFRLWAIEKYLKENIKALKTLLNNLTIEDLNWKYSIIMELFCEKLWYDYDSIEYDSTWIEFYRLWKDWKKYRSFWAIYSWILKEMKVKLLLELWFIEEKTFEEMVDKWLFTYEPDNRFSDDIFWYAVSEDLNNQTDAFLWVNKKLVFSEKQEKFLKVIFEQFSVYEYIAVRSSANVEDWWDYNYPWVFYTWFCNTNDFELFKDEVIKVLESSEGQDKIKYQEKFNLDEDVFMWIEIMAVHWEYHEHLTSDSPDISFHYWSAGFEMKKKNSDNEILFYPDWWWVLNTDDLWDDWFMVVKWVKWMPTSITSNNDQNITVHLEKWTWKILAYENMPWNFDYYCQTWISWLSIDSKIKYHIELVQSMTSMDRHNIKDNMCYNELKNSDNCSKFLPFSLSDYENLAALYPLLKEKLWFDLELEFTIQDNEIYIIQSRKSTSNFNRPKNLVKPNELIHENLLLDSDIESSMWYIDNENLDLFNISLSHLLDLSNKIVEEGYVETQRFWKPGREDWVLEIIDNINKKNISWYMILFDWLSDFPLINRDNYPNLRCIITNWVKWLWTHALMRIREAWIPVIFLKNSSKFNRNIKDWKYNVYLDGNKDAMIYV